MNGKRKGSGFERLVARELSLYLTGGESRTELIRSVLSGGWSPGQESGEGWRQVGDLSPNGPAGEQFRARFAVECKHRRRISLHDLWTKRSKDSLSGWWLKIRLDSAAARVCPMLIFRGNGMPIMVAMRTGDVPAALFDSEAIVASFRSHDLAALSFDDLRLNVPPEHFLGGPRAKG